ncbi:hypothetical protein [Mycolicibacterium sp.]|uniref:hypothetical protein n=1 Tax=Mycolicibacterium sp. TaxID=2320850 RepID=UPI003D1216FE
MTVVLVTGPADAGVTSVAARLRERMPDVVVADRELTAGDVASVVVFVVSAVAPVIESDCALAALACAHTDAVIAVVNKTDDHRGWRTVLATDRARLAEHAPRFTRTPWVGAAAAPRLGGPDVDELVDAVRGQLADLALPVRNTLRALDTRVLRVTRMLAVDHTGTVAALRSRRAQLVREQRAAATDTAVTVRREIRSANVALAHRVRTGTALMRTELLEALAGTGRRGLPDFEHRVRSRCAELTAAVDAEISVALAAVATTVGLAEPPAAPPSPTPVVAASTPQRLEAALMTVLGVGFGLGVAVVVTRLVAALAGLPSAVSGAAGAGAGLAVTVWVVGVRGLLRDRAVLDRWVGDVTVVLRAALEERVATRVVAAEALLTSARAAAAEADRARWAERIAGVDSAVREVSRIAACADGARAAVLPSLRGLRETIGTALTGPPVVTDR